MTPQPPLARRVLYRLFLVRLGPEWREWLERDVRTRGFLVWHALAELVLGAVTLALIYAVFRVAPLRFVAIYVAVRWASLLLPWGRRLGRERVLSWHRRKWQDGASS